MFLTIRADIDSMGFKFTEILFRFSSERTSRWRRRSGRRNATPIHLNLVIWSMGECTFQGMIHTLPRIWSWELGFQSGNVRSCRRPMRWPRPQRSLFGASPALQLQLPESSRWVWGLMFWCPSLTCSRSVALIHLFLFSIWIEFFIIIFYAQLSLPCRRSTAPTKIPRPWWALNFEHLFV